MPDPLLTLRKFATSEDQEDQKALAQAQRAEADAADILVGGVLLSSEATLGRLELAIDRQTGEAFCGCQNCERVFTVSLDSSRAAYYTGLAVGLRLARATEPVAADAGGAS